MKNYPDNDELKDAPILKGIPKHDPFVVPDGFFDQFPHQVQSHIIAAQGQNTGPKWLHLFSKPALIGSICALLVAVLTWWVWPTSTHEQAIAEQETREEAEIYSLEDLDDAEIYSLMANAENTMAEVDLPMDDEVLIDYLENENLSLYFLTEEL